jgi:hypothetical protein
MHQFMKNTLYLLLLLTGFGVQATHLQGGYIRATPVPGQARTYTITVFLYTYPQSVATSELTSSPICFGDGTTATVPRKSLTTLTTDGQLAAAVFETTHTYAGAGTYTLLLALTNRSPQINAPSTIDSQPLTLTTTILIDNILTNQTPLPSIPATSLTLSVNQRAVLSLRATDADGDSLVYRLAQPLTSSNISSCSSSGLNGYIFPNDVTRQGTFTLNSRTGELVWNAPVRQGRYTLAIYIDEYRNGIPLSRTVQEIPLTVEDRSGTPATIPAYEPASTAGLVTAVTEPRDATMQLSVFPNPVEENLQVVVQSNSPASVVIQLFDANGRLMHRLGSRTAVRRHEQVIGMGSLSAGTYLIRADVAGRILTEKVVKK